MFTKKQFAQLIAAIQVISLFAMPISVYAADYTTPINVGSGSILEIKSTEYDNVDISGVSGYAVCVSGTGSLHIFDDKIGNITNNVTLESTNSTVLAVTGDASAVINGNVISVSRGNGGVSSDYALYVSGNLDIGNDTTSSVTNTADSLSVGDHNSIELSSLGVLNVRGQNITVETDGRAIDGALSNRGGIANIGTETTNYVKIGASSLAVAGSCIVGGICNSYGATTATTNVLGKHIEIVSSGLWTGTGGVYNTNGTVNIGTETTENVSVSGVYYGIHGRGNGVVVKGKDIAITKGQVYGNVVLGTEQTETVNINGGSGIGSVGTYTGSNTVIHGKQICLSESMGNTITMDGGSLEIGDNNSVVNIDNTNTSVMSGIMISDGDNNLTVNGKDITISRLSAAYGDSGIVKIGTADSEKVKVTTPNTAFSAVAIGCNNCVSIEGQEVAIEGDIKFDGLNPGTKTLEINKGGTGVVKIDRNIIGESTSAGGRKYVLDLTLNGNTSYLNGVVTTGIENTDYTVNIKNAARWNIPGTATCDSKVNNLNVDNATINITAPSTTKTLYVDTLKANDLTIAGTDATKNNVQFTNATVTGDLNLSNVTTQATGTFVADNANINGDIALNGTTDFKGTNTIEGAITGTATVNINSGVTAIDDTNGSVANNIVTASGGTLKANASKVTAANFTNNGTYDVTGGTLTQAITGSGNIAISGDVINDAGVTQTQAVTVNSTHSLTNNGTLAGDVTNKGSVTNIATISGDFVNEANALLENNGTMANVTSNGDVDNNGTMTSVTNNGIFENRATGSVSGLFTNNENGTLVNNGTLADVINSGKATNNNIITGTVANDKTGGFTNSATGVIEKTVTNDGKFTNDGIIKGDLTNKGGAKFTNETTGVIEGNATNEKNAIMINKGAINGWLVNDGDYTSKGGKVLDIITNNGNFTANVDDIVNTVYNKGRFVFTGGTLNAPLTNTGELVFKGKTTISAATTLSGTLAFYLDNFKANDTIVIATTPMDVSKTSVVLYHNNSEALYNENDTVTLIKGATGYSANSTSPNSIIAKNSSTGLPTDYEYDVYSAEDSLIAKYTGVSKPSEENKSLSEGRLAGAVALTQANDIMANDGVEMAVSIARESKGKGSAFATVQGNYGRYNTGSHIDLNSFNVAAGLAKAINENTTLGAFVEGGNGRYASYNEFTNSEVRADGDINYFGAGVFARHNFTMTDKGNMYADASFGAGNTNQDYASENVGGAKNVRYDTSQAYLKAHATIGYEWKLQNSSRLNTYAKYLWTRQNGDSAQIAKDTVNFDAINSNRLRAGFRYTQDIKKTLSWYGGLAYEYEFSMTAGANSKGFAIAEPDLKGASGMAELGFKYAPKKYEGLTFDAGVQGYTGKRDSIAVRLGVWYNF